MGESAAKHWWGRVWVIAVVAWLLFAAQLWLALGQVPIATYFPSFFGQALVVFVLLSAAIVCGNLSRWRAFIVVSLFLVHVLTVPFIIKTTAHWAGMTPATTCSLVSDDMPPAERPGAKGWYLPPGDLGWTDLSVDTSYFGVITCRWYAQDGSGRVLQSHSDTLWPYVGTLGSIYYW